MRVAEVYGDNIKTVLDLSPRVIYELAAPSTPPEARNVTPDALAAHRRMLELVTTIQAPMALAMAHVFLRQMESISTTARVMGADVGMRELNKTIIELRRLLQKNPRDP